jgi:hypothetical protein
MAKLGMFILVSIDEQRHFTKFVKRPVSTFMEGNPTPGTKEYRLQAIE